MAYSYSLVAKHGEDRGSASRGDKIYKLRITTDATDGSEPINTIVARDYFANNWITGLFAPEFIVDPSANPLVPSAQLQDVRVTEDATRGDHSTGVITYGLYNLECSWGAFAFRYQQPPGVASAQVTLRTSLTTVRQKAAQAASIYYQAADFPEHDFGGLINVTVDGEVEGVDVQIPTSVLGVTAVLPNANPTGGAASVGAYAAATTAIVGKTNAAAYRTFAIGTLLCSGVTLSPSDADHFKVDAEFLYSPNATGLTVGRVNGVNKDGWQYLWVYPREMKQSVGGRDIVSQEPAQVAVETLYGSANFLNALGF